MQDGGAREAEHREEERANKVADHSNNGSWDHWLLHIWVAVFDKDQS